MFDTDHRSPTPIIDDRCSGMTSDIRQRPAMFDTDHRSPTTIIDDRCSRMTIDIRQRPSISTTTIDPRRRSSTIDARG
jgi:hypothetical protein